MGRLYRADKINELVDFISTLNGIGDKSRLVAEVQSRFGLVRDRSVYYGDYFAIRFSQARSIRFSNTVLSLSNLKKFDDIPFLICVVTAQENYLLLSNSSFLKKVSHSSHALREDNIRGSFNGSDIILNYSGLPNAPENFEELFDLHAQFEFEENLARLVAATNGIVGRDKALMFNEREISTILGSIARAQDFFDHTDYFELEDDLNSRVELVLREIVVAAFIDNVNLRGRIIEFLITSPLQSSQDLRTALLKSTVRPDIFTGNDLGDYDRHFEEFVTKTDIKTKVMFLGSNPKGYNVDKLLRFLSEPASVYLIFIVAVDRDDHVRTRLCSVFSEELMRGTRVLEHWSGRNSRGVTQFTGSSLEVLIDDEDIRINSDQATDFLLELLNR